MIKSYVVIRWGKENNISKCNTYEDAKYLYQYYNSNLEEYLGVSLLIIYA